MENSCQNSDKKCWWLCLLAFKFPETTNDKLPETTTDALQLGKNVKRNKFGVIISVWWSAENTKIIFILLFLLWSALLIYDRNNSVGCKYFEFEEGLLQKSF